MRRGCLDNLLFAFLLLVGFGASTYFWFTFFVRGRSLSTPDLIGKSVTEARAIASDLGVTLKVDSQRRNSNTVPIDHVVWQNRPPGTARLIKRGSTIRVELSAGPLVLSVPDLDGQTPGTGMLRLGQQNLKLGHLAYIENSAKQGVLAADPPKGTIVQAQTPVSLLVGVQPAPPVFVMPDLIDQPLDQVRPLLERRGLTITTVKYEAYPGIRDGIIIRQYPLRGAPVSSRDPITVVVSRQEETNIVEGSPTTQPVQQP